MRRQKLNEIRICDFKSIPGDHTLSIGMAFKNLMIYGENGSGKTTIFDAVKLLFTTDGPDFDDDTSKITCLRNRFSTGDPSGHITLLFSDTYSPLEWIINESRPSENHYDLIRRMSRFINYKDILNIHINNDFNEHIDIFYSFVHSIIANTETFTGSRIRFIDEWNSIKNKVESLLNISLLESISDNPTLANSVNYNENIWFGEDNANPSRQDKIEASNSFKEQFKSDLFTSVQNFSRHLDNLCRIINEKSNDILSKFENGLTIDIETQFDPTSLTIDNILISIKILVKVKYRDIDIQHPGIFLNEARLTALALSINFAGLLSIAPLSGIRKWCSTPNNTR